MTRSQNITLKGQKKIVWKGVSRMQVVRGGPRMMKTFLRKYAFFKIDYRNEEVRMDLS